MQSTFVQYSPSRDWHNRHYDTRQYWLAWPYPETRRPSLAQQLRQFLHRLGGHVNTGPPPADPEPPERRN